MIIFSLATMYIFNSVAHRARDMRINGASSGLSRVLVFIEQHSRKTQYKMIVALVAYSIMLLPWAYSYQYIGLGILNVIMQLNSLAIDFIRDSAGNRKSREVSASGSASKHSSQRPAVVVAIAASSSAGVHESASPQ